jgi:hypothetical protein
MIMSLLYRFVRHLQRTAFGLSLDGQVRCELHVEDFGGDLPYEEQQAFVAVSFDGTLVAEVGTGGSTFVGEVHPDEVAVAAARVFQD